MQGIFFVTQTHVVADFVSFACAHHAVACPLAIWSRFSLPRRIALYRGANMFLPVSATGGGRTCCPSPQKGSTCERRRRRIQRAGTGAAVETVSGQSRVRRFREPQGKRSCGCSLASALTTPPRRYHLFAGCPVLLWFCSTSFCPRQQAGGSF